MVQNLSTVVAESSNSLTLRLDPPELGELDVEFTQSDEGLAIRVRAREPVTMEMLLSRGGEIEQILRSQDADIVKVEFSAPDSDGRDHESTDLGAGQHDQQQHTDQQPRSFEIAGQTARENRQTSNRNQPRRNSDSSRVRIRA